MCDTTQSGILCRAAMCDMCDTTQSGTLCRAACAHDSFICVTQPNQVLFAGLPVLTRPGLRTLSRMGASLASVRDAFTCVT